MGGKWLTLAYFIALICFASASLLSKCGKSPMLIMLDSMQQMMSREGDQFDRVYYTKLRSCMDKFDVILPASQDGGWDGIIKYWKMGGANGDRWGLYDGFNEDNLTMTSHLSMAIYEPCNYASNVAYYHVVTELCDRQTKGPAFNLPDKYIKGLVQAFSSLAIGSSFLHGTTTRLGGQQDVTAISVFAYILHQAIVAPFKSNSTIINDLSETAVANTGLQLAEKFKDMHLSMPVEMWYDHTRSLNIMAFRKIFAGITASLISIVTPGLENSTVEALADAFGLSASIKTFLLEKYLPELQNFTAKIQINPAVRLDLLNKMKSTSLKLVYSFLWQEELISALDDIIFLPIINQIGSLGLSGVNGLANSISSNIFYEPDFQNGQNIFPGDYWCNNKIPHTKWHLESAIALLDLIYLADSIHGALK